MLRQACITPIVEEAVFASVSDRLLARHYSIPCRENRVLIVPRMAIHLTLNVVAFLPDHRDHLISKPDRPGRQPSLHHLPPCVRRRQHAPGGVALARAAVKEGNQLLVPAARPEML